MAVRRAAPSAGRAARRRRSRRRTPRCGAALRASAGRRARPRGCRRGSSACGSRRRSAVRSSASRSFRISIRKRDLRQIPGAAGSKPDRAVLDGVRAVERQRLAGRQRDAAQRLGRQALHRVAVDRLDFRGMRRSSGTFLTMRRSALESIDENRRIPLPARRLLPTLWPADCSSEVRRSGRLERARRSETMNIEKYTERARGFIQSAQSLALREGHQQFTPEHLLKVLLDDPEGLAAGLIDRAGGDSRAGAAARSKRRSPSCRRSSGGGRRPGLSRAGDWRASSTPPRRSPRRPATASSRSSGCCSRSRSRRTARPARSWPRPASRRRT